MPLAANAGMLLGMLSLYPQSGYELKKHSDVGLRAFWTIGYPQLYRELAALRRAGLIRVASRARLRGRTTYTVTPRGARALDAWLREGAGAVELRDELLLKLFLAATVRPALVARVAAAIGTRVDAQLAGLDAAERHLRETADHDEGGALVVLELVRDLYRGYRASATRIATGTGGSASRGRGSSRR